METVRFHLLYVIIKKDFMALEQIFFNPERKIINIKEVIPNEDNPRTIKKKKLEALVERIKDSSHHGSIRPIVVNEKMVILGGNQRWLAYKHLRYKEVLVLVLTRKDLKPFMKASGKTYAEICDDFVLDDNWHAGEFDYKALVEKYGAEELVERGYDVPASAMGGAAYVQPEVQFSEFLDEEHNYVVLYFDNRIDWLQAQTHFDLKTVSSKRSNGKEWSKGVGRVINGAKYLKALIQDMT